MEKAARVMPNKEKKENSERKKTRETARGKCGAFGCKNQALRKKQNEPHGNVHGDGYGV